MIVGNRATGKSTKVEKVADTLPGVIYVSVNEGDTNIATTLNTAFQKALHWEEFHGYG